MCAGIQELRRAPAEAALQARNLYAASTPKVSHGRLHASHTASDWRWRAIDDVLLHWCAREGDRAPPRGATHRIVVPIRGGAPVPSSTSFHLRPHLEVLRAPDASTCVVRRRLVDLGPACKHGR